MQAALTKILLFRLWYNFIQDIDILFAFQTSFDACRKAFSIVWF